MQLLPIRVTAVLGQDVPNTYQGVSKVALDERDSLVKYFAFNLFRIVGRVPPSQPELKKSGAGEASRASDCMTWGLGKKKTICDVQQNSHVENMRTSKRNLFSDLSKTWTDKGDWGKNNL